MEDILDFDSYAREHAGPVRQERGTPATTPARARPELAAGETIDIYHWAAVALVTSLMCAVLGYAAGTPGLARAANVTSVVFGVAGGALMVAGILRRLRLRTA